jgi:hypothetical protein
MFVVRAILAAAIALSVAIAPATAGAAAPAMPAGMAMPGEMDSPCCPPDDGKSSVACAAKCFNCAGPVLPAAMIARPGRIDRALPPFVNDALHSHVSSPPTHPPPV